MRQPRVGIWKCTDAVTRCGKRKRHCVSKQRLRVGVTLQILCVCLAKHKGTLAPLRPSTCSELFSGSSKDSTSIWGMDGSPNSFEMSGDSLFLSTESTCKDPSGHSQVLPTWSGTVFWFAVFHLRFTVLEISLKKMTWVCLYQLEVMSSLISSPWGFIHFCPIECLSESGVPVSYRTSREKASVPTVIWGVMVGCHDSSHRKL